MNIKIMKCDEINSNNRIYPKEIVEKAIEEFNKRDKDDISRIVFASSEDTLNYDTEIPITKKRTLGKITELKIDDNDYVIGEFDFDNSPLGKNMKSIISSNKEISCDFYNNRVIMCSGGLLDTIEDDYKVKDMEIYGFHFGLDSAWRND